MNESGEMECSPQENADQKWLKKWGQFPTTLGNANVCKSQVISKDS